MSLVSHSASVFPSWLYTPLGERPPCYPVVLESSIIPGAQDTRVCSLISKPVWVTTALSTVPYCPQTLFPHGPETPGEITSGWLCPVRLPFCIYYYLVLFSVPVKGQLPPTWSRGFLLKTKHVDPALFTPSAMVAASGNPFKGGMLEVWRRCRW